MFGREIKHIYKSVWKDFKPVKAKNAYESIRLDRYLEVFDTPQHIIAFQNGLFDMEERRFSPLFDWRYHITKILPYSYTDICKL